jgi:tetratricopeptide (TPR) repeat protein
MANPADKRVPDLLKPVLGLSLLLMLAACGRSEAPSVPGPAVEDEGPPVLVRQNQACREAAARIDFERANPLCLEALETAASHSRESKVFAAALANTGYLMHQRGAYEDAETFYEEALALQRQLYGEDSTELITVLSDFGTLLVQMRRPDEAVPHYAQALELAEAAQGESGARVSEVLAGFAEVREAQGRLEDAEALYARALEIDRFVLGERHANVAVAKNNLATVYQLQGRLEEAEKLFVEALGMLRESLGEEHPFTYSVYRNLAETREMIVERGVDERESR